MPVSAALGEPDHGRHLLVPRGDYESMHRALLERIVEEQGSLRRAAKVLRIPRSTLGHWLRRDAEDRAAIRRRPAGCPDQPGGSRGLPPGLPDPRASC